MNFFRRLYEKIFYIEEHPEDSLSVLNRRWRYKLDYGVYRGRLHAGPVVQLVQYEGKRLDYERLTKMLDFQFFYDPRDWKVKSSHMWYDGEHCYWQLGPFALYRHWNSTCKKCYAE